MFFCVCACAGSESGFYQWSRGVSVRANLDLLLDWAHASGPGLGELVLEHTHTLSSAVNLLATPRESLVQVSSHTHRQAYRYSHIHMHAYTYIFTHTCTHRQVYSNQTHTYTHSHIHMYIGRLLILTLMHTHTVGYNSLQK